MYYKVHGWGKNWTAVSHPTCFVQPYFRHMYLVFYHFLVKHWSIGLFNILICRISSECLRNTIKRRRANYFYAWFRTSTQWPVATEYGVLYLQCTREEIHTIGDKSFLKAPSSGSLPCQICRKEQMFSRLQILVRREWVWYLSWQADLRTC